MYRLDMQNFSINYSFLAKGILFEKCIVLKVVNVCKIKELLTCQNQGEENVGKKFIKRRQQTLCFMLVGYNRKTWRPCTLHSYMWPQFFIPPGKEFFRFCEKAVITFYKMH